MSPHGGCTAQPVRGEAAKVPPMIRPIRAFKLSRIAVGIACVAFLCALAGAATAGAESTTTIVYTKESKPAYEAQLAGHQIQSATFNKKIRSLHLTLKNGTHVLYRYGAHEEKKIAAALKAGGVPVSVLTKSAATAEAAKKPVKHKLRYIAGGIVIVVIVIVAVVLLVDRRRKRGGD